jgi:PAS domain S-box-containing protein
MDTASLEHEIAVLRESLQEARDICHAIKHGEVDAIVVGQSDEQKRVLLMSGAYMRYRQLVEDMSQGAVTIAGSGDILFSNHGFAAMVGESPVDLFRTPLERWVAAEDKQLVATLRQGRLGQRDIELKLKRTDGASLLVRVSLVNASDDFVTLLVTDLSGRTEEREEAEATLEAIRNGAVDGFVVGGGKQVLLLETANTLYRAMVERMRQGAVTVAAGGEIVYANERFLSMIAMPHGRLIGSRLPELITESDRAAFLAMLSEKGNARAELRLKSANGQRPVTLAAMTTMDGHKLFLFTDMTEQKRHEASDERTRKFLGMLAHEFRDMLGPIGNSVQYLKRSGTLEPEGQKAVEIIERQTERLLGLVEDLRRINPRD